MIYLVFDLETTNRMATRAEVLTGHFIALNESLEVIDEYSLESRPELWDDDAQKASEIHGVCKYTSLTFPPKQVAMSKLMDWIDQFQAPVHLVCHANRRIGGFKSYDYTVLSFAMLDCGLYFDFTSKCRAMHIISTHSLAKHLNVNSALDLKSLTNHFKIELDNHHDAKSDAYACMGIFKKLITEVDLEQFLDQEFNGGSKNELNSEATPSSSRVRKKRNHFSNLC